MNFELDTTLLMSSVWYQPNSTRLVWITMLLLSEQDDTVLASVPAIAHRSNVSLDETVTALEWLSSPDPLSEMIEFEGRRIERINGGWKILYPEDKLSQTESEYPQRYSTRSRASNVYFILSGEHIKIGYSRNPESRMEQLKSGLAHEPIMLGYAAGLMSDERRLHKKFHHLRKHGEWFDAKPELLEFIPKWLLEKKAKADAEFAEEEQDLEKSTMNQSA